MKKSSKENKPRLNNFKNALKILKYPLLATLILTIVLKYPKYHESYIFKKVGNKTVYLLNAAGTGGGTGFYVKAASGKTYILTNDHICGMAEKGPIMIEDEIFYRSRPVRIIERSGTTDLCLIESPSNVKGLDLAKGYAEQDQVFVLGHPLLKPLILSKGNIYGKSKIQVLDYFIETEEQKASCNKKKNKIEEFDTLFGKVTACTALINAFDTTAIIFPGNSGSPVVNFYGDVVGIAFAGDSRSNWGSVVPVEDIKDFLQSY